MRFVGRLSALGFELCQLTSAAGIGMIGAHGTLKIFHGQAKRGARFFVFSLGQEGASQIQVGVAYDARERAGRARGLQ
jgi:hypothetical protein